MSITLPSKQESRFRAAQVSLSNYQGIIEDALGKLPKTLSEEEKKPFEGFPPLIRHLETLKRFQVEEEFPQMARCSLLVLVFIVMETEIHYLCGGLESLKALPIRANEIKGDILDRLHTYCVKLAKLPPPDTASWQTVRQIEQIRHCIVHADGEVARSQSAASLRQLVGKIPGYGIDSNGYITLSSKTVTTAIQVFSTLLNHFIKEAGFPEQTLPT